MVIDGLMMIMTMMMVIWAEYESLVREVRPDQATCHDTAHQPVPRHGQAHTSNHTSAMWCKFVHSLSSQRRDLDFYKSGPTDSVTDVSPRPASREITR